MSVYKLVDLVVVASKSFIADVSQIFTESLTDKTIWLLIGGIVAIIIGLAGLLSGQFKKT